MVKRAAEGEVGWWTGVPTQLLAKECLVTADPNNEISPRLAVYKLTFAIPSDPEHRLIDKAIPHAQLDLAVGDVVKIVIPDYKPKSYSVSALRLDAEPPQFDVTFKVYPNGRASGHLDSLQIEDSIHTFGKLANRVRNTRGNFVGIVAYGVGITEAWPVAKAELRKHESSSVTLLWANRSLADVFWKEEIDHVSKLYPERLVVRYIFSREPKPVLVDGMVQPDIDAQGNTTMYGRVNADVLKEVFQPKDPSEALFLVVGTKEMMRYTYDELLTEQMGYRMPQNAFLVKKEKGEKEGKTHKKDSKRKRESVEQKDESVHFQE